MIWNRRERPGAEVRAHSRQTLPRGALGQGVSPVLRRRLPPVTDRGTSIHRRPEHSNLRPAVGMDSREARQELTGLVDAGVAVARGARVRAQDPDGTDHRDRAQPASGQVRHPAPARHRSRRLGRKTRATKQPLRTSALNSARSSCRSARFPRRSGRPHQDGEEFVGKSIHMAPIMDENGLPDDLWEAIRPGSGDRI